MSDWRRAVAACVLVFAVALPVRAQSAEGATAPDRETEATAAADTAADSEQRAPEVPRWARDLRRAEIVAAGTFPLTLLASRLVYGLIRFGARSIEAGAINVNYAPGLFAPPGAPGLASGEKLGIIVDALVLSVLIAALDYQRGLSPQE